jgi:phosphatidylinositol alpha-1,6-mannosyltransferase
MGALLLVYCRVSHLRSVAFLYGRDILLARESVTGLILLNCALRFANRLIVNSFFTKSILPNGATELTVIYPAVDPEILNLAMQVPRNEQVRRILFVGRLVERKGVDVLLRAFQESLKEIPNVELDIVGDGPEIASLRNLSRELLVEDKVLFHGALTGSRLYERYYLSDVVAMPSRSSTTDVEGFGTVFLEAGLFGKPAVGTKTGGIPEAIIDGETGVLVPEGDHHALALALNHFLGNEEMRARMGSRAHERVLSDFTLAQAVDKIEWAIGD